MQETLAPFGDRVPGPRIRVLVADDHTVVREGIASLLARSGYCEIVAEASNGLEAVERTLELHPDVVVMDMTMPRLGGLEAVRRIHAELPDVRILVLTMHDEQEYIVPVVRAGAAGYLLKNAPTVELVAAVRALHAGKGFFAPEAAHAIAQQLRGGEESGDPYRQLTPREREVFHLVIEGKPTKEFARGT